MWELWTSIEANKGATKDLEVNYDFIALGISRCVGGCNPIIFNGAIGKDARIKVCCLTGFAIKPEACNEIHG
jgi:hypothetical protein